MNGRTLSAGMAPQPPPVPEIEGYLKKLKRKTSNLSGSWNKRWFFVDQKRREFGYANSKTPGAPKSSIYLNDITAVVQFDDTHFQVESRTRNLFLCGDSKASATCWVKSLDEYRKKQLAYEKDKATYDAMLAAAQSRLSVEAQAAFSPKAVAAVGQMQISSSDDRRQDSFSSSSSLTSNASATSSSKRSGRTGERQARKEERRTPSPPEHRRSDRDSSASRQQSERSGTDKSERRRDKDKDTSRGREREREKDRSREREREARAKTDNASSSRTNSRELEKRSIADATSVRAHPGKGRVIQAWGLDDDDV